MVVGRLLSYWEGNFSGALLNFGGVPPSTNMKNQEEKVLKIMMHLINMVSHGDLGTEASKVQVSQEKNPPTFHSTGWLIGILIMVYYNLYI